MVLEINVIVLFLNLTLFILYFYADFQLEP